MKGLVLTGGKSSRMGTPKAELNYHGEPEFLRISRLLSEVCDEVLISVSEFWAPRERVPYTLLPDEPQVSLGPLSGIFAAFNRHPDAAFIVLACDMPLFDAAALAELVSQRDSSAQATCFALDGKTPEPLCGIYESSAASDIREALANDIRCARRLMDAMRTKRVVPQNPAWVRNVNDKDEFESFGKEGPELSVDVHFVAMLREKAGKNSERIVTRKSTPRALYEELRAQYGFSITPKHMRVAINDELVDWAKPLCDNDRVIFVPPVAGG